MEWKIGEIKQINGEWFQCVRGQSEEKCTGCFFEASPICIDLNCLGNERKDHTKVIFKKLEKVGEPTLINGKRVQLIKALKPNTSCYNCCFYSDRKCLIPEVNHESNSFYVEIKQNKEDMKQEKLNLKPFDLEAAKVGKPVCTRDGREARIICFNAKRPYGKTDILALVSDNNGGENPEFYNMQGKFSSKGDDDYDLMMLPEKKEGWVNVDKRSNGDVIISKPYPTRDEAIHNSTELTIDTVKIQWEE